ncbi:MAG TPA: DUF58 domain-containing protein [Polyangiaceae bacterium]|nr:DUF58 domain-containing protein [Polyangiaceae bacterium]
MIPKELLKALRKIEITTNRLANEQLSGNYTSGFKGQGLAFSEVRQYQPGDDIRTIDWNVSARMNEAYVKVFTEEREMTVMLLVDVSSSGSFGTRTASKARVAAEVAALCAFSAIKNNDRVGLILVSDRVEKIVPPQKGQKHVLRVIREILGAKPSGVGTDLAEGLHTLAKVARRRSVAFCLSDFFCDGYERALSLAAARHDLVPILIADPRDDELVDVGLASFEDLETGEEVLVDTRSPSVRQHYQKSMQEYRQAQLRLFKKFGLDHCIVRTDRPYINPLRELFARRAKRAHR